VANEITGSLCASMTRLVASASPASESVGFWTMLTLYPSSVSFW